LLQVNYCIKNIRRINPTDEEEILTLLNDEEPAFGRDNKITNHYTNSQVNF
jgi:hypothetical protein